MTWPAQPQVRQRRVLRAASDMPVITAVLFAVAICAVIEFIVPSQIALFYSMLGGPSRRESRRVIDTPERNRTKKVRFLILLLPALVLTYFTTLSYIPAVIGMMIFILAYSSYVSFIEIRLVRKNHLRS